MGNIKKIVLISLIVMFVVFYFVEAVYIQKNLDTKISKLEKEAVIIDTKKKVLTEKQHSLKTTNQILARQLLAEKTSLENKKIEAQIQILKEQELEKISALQSQQLLDLQQADSARLVELQKQLASSKITSSSTKPAAASASNPAPPVTNPTSTPMPAPVTRAS